MAESEVEEYFGIQKENPTSLQPKRQEKKCVCLTLGHCGKLVRYVIYKVVEEVFFRSEVVPAHIPV